MLLVLWWVWNRIEEGKRFDEFGAELAEYIKVIMLVEFVLCDDFIYKVDGLFDLVLVILVMQIW